MIQSNNLRCGWIGRLHIDIVWIRISFCWLWRSCISRLHCRVFRLWFRYCGNLCRIAIFWVWQGTDRLNSLHESLLLYVGKMGCCFFLFILDAPNESPGYTTRIFSPDEFAIAVWYNDLNSVLFVKCNLLSIILESNRFFLCCLFKPIEYLIKS